PSSMREPYSFLSISATSDLPRGSTAKEAMRSGRSGWKGAFSGMPSIRLIMLAFSRVGSIPEIPVENVPVATALLPDMQKDNQQKDTHTALLWLLVISVACAGMQTGMRVL